MGGTEEEERKPFSPLLFIPAAMFHLTSRILLFIGLTLTSASSFQMLSGCNLVFTSILSKVFLKKSLPWYKWFGIAVITAGVVIVGVGDLVQENEHDDNEVTKPVTGDIFVVIGMIFWACQMTYEEKFVKKYNIMPLNVIGLEGSFSLTILTFLLVVFFFIPPFLGILDGDRMEDALDGFVQLGNNPILLTSFVCTTLALCVALIAGIHVTRELSAIHRIIIDSGRSIAVWGISLAASWQSFLWLQVLGFFIMSLGVFIFNDILIGKKSEAAMTMSALTPPGPGVRTLLELWGCRKSRDQDSQHGRNKDAELTGRDNPVFVKGFTKLDLE